MLKFTWYTVNLAHAKFWLENFLKQDFLGAKKIKYSTCPRAKKNFYIMASQNSKNK